MKYLTSQRILFIHDQIIKQTGGSMGVRDIGLIESAVGRPMATFDGKDLYTTIFDKASALLQSLLKNHPFVDGNKRTALVSSALFLELNGLSLINSHEEEVDFAIKVNNKNLTIKEISKWLRTHSHKNHNL